MPTLQPIGDLSKIFYAWSYFGALGIQYRMPFPYILKLKTSELMRFPRGNIYHDMGRLLGMQY